MQLGLDEVAEHRLARAGQTREPMTEGVRRILARGSLSTVSACIAMLCVGASAKWIDCRADRVVRNPVDQNETTPCRFCS
jgi:hypothetical protein